MARTLGGRTARSLAAWTQFTLLTSTSPIGAEASHSSTLITGFGCGVRVFKFAGRLLVDAISQPGFDLSAPQRVSLSYVQQKFRGRERWALSGQQRRCQKIPGSSLDIEWDQQPLESGFVEAGVNIEVITLPSHTRPNLSHSGCLDLLCCSLNSPS